MQQDSIVVRSSNPSILTTNKVLRNTYAMLALTLLFSAATASLAVIKAAPPLNPFIMLIAYFGLLFLTNMLRNSSWGILAVFALTGFLGYTLGPILNFYIHNVSNGPQLVAISLAGTGIIFLALSAYALISQRDFSFMAGFLMIGLIVAFLASLAGLFFHLPALTLAVSAAFILLSSGVILLQTSAIVHGGETNYLMATITVYVALYNIFISLLQLLSFFNNRE